MFVVAAALVYFLILLIPLLGVSSRKSVAMANTAQRIRNLDLQLHPSDDAWMEAFELTREALEIDPANTNAATLLSALGIGSRPIVDPDRFDPSTWRDMSLSKSQLSWSHFESYEVPNLPNTYVQLMSKTSSEFEWVTDMYGGPYTSEASRPKSLTRRIRRFFASKIGAMSPSWISGLVAVFILTPIYFTSEGPGRESQLSQTYRSVCESLLGDCGGKIRGFDRNDAVDAVTDVLSDRHPTILAMEDVQEFTDLNRSCWDYAADLEVLVDVTDQGFIVTFGYKEYFDPDDWDFIATSMWRAAPPNDDSRGGWQVTGSGEGGWYEAESGNWDQLEYKCDSEE